MLSTDPDNEYIYKSKVYQPGERSVLDSFNGSIDDKNVKLHDNRINSKVDGQQITQTLKRVLDRERSKNKSSLAPKGIVRVSSENEYDNNIKNKSDNDNNLNLEFECQCVRWAIRQNCDLSRENNQQLVNDDCINKNNENNALINIDNKDIEYEVIIIVDGIKTYDVIDSSDINGFGSSNQSLRKRW